MKPYLSYLHLKEKIDQKKNLIAVYRLEPENGEDFNETAGGIAAESSVGTWTKLNTEVKKVWQTLHARVFEADKTSGLLKIAYPLDLFEPNNIPQLLSSVAGNVFGMKTIENLRLEDLELPEKYVISFSGPEIGINGIRKIVQVSDQPLIGSIIKPKLGLPVDQHVKIALEAFQGGVNLVKDDENLTSQKFSLFGERVKEILKELKNLGFSNKLYAFNITASTGVMDERAELVKTLGGNCIMIDILTCGFSALQDIRQKNYGLIIHAHRAMHGALTRGQHGISMLVIAKLSRLAGVDALHTGTVIGKMEGKKEEILKINEFLRSEWYGLKRVLPVASGGLHPGMTPELISILGNEVILNFGGGIHGHPSDSKAGAKAVVQAVEAVKKGVSLQDYAKDHQELKIALGLWGES